MTKPIDDAWLDTEIRWAEWNGEEFQCIDVSAAREMLAEIKRLRDTYEKIGVLLPDGTLSTYDGVQDDYEPVFIRKTRSKLLPDPDPLF